MSGSGSGSKGSGSGTGSASGSAKKSKSTSYSTASASKDVSQESVENKSESKASKEASKESKSKSKASTESKEASSSSSSSVELQKPEPKSAPLKLPTTTTSPTDGEETTQNPISPRKRQTTGQLLVSPRRAARPSVSDPNKYAAREEGRQPEEEKFDVEEFWVVGTWTSTIYAWRTYLAEFVAVMLFVFMGTGVVVATAGRYGGADGGTIVAIGFAFGLAIATMVYCAANLSGGHLNPAVTIAIFVAMKIPLLQAIGYIIAQVLGALVGSALVLAVTPFNVGKTVCWGCTTLAKAVPFNLYVDNNGTLTQQVYSVSQTQGFFMELIMTFILVFTIFSTAGVAADAKSVGRFAPLSIGFAVFINVMLGATLTGGSLNPARSFGPAVISGVWDDHWVYWAGPIAGGILAGLVFKYIFVTKEEMRAQVLLAEKLERESLEAAAMEQERMNRKGM